MKISMKKIVTFFCVVVIGFGPVFLAHPAPCEQEAITTLLLVRHAEKAASIWEDPGLTPSGAARADELAYILKHVKLDAVYSTPFKRTKMTASPTAKEKGLEVKLYNTKEDGFLKKVIREFHGGTVLIVGHSNTIPRMANALEGRPIYSDLDDATYDNLFIASVPAEGKAVLLRLRFGDRTPEKKRSILPLSLMKNSGHKE